MTNPYFGPQIDFSQLTAMGEDIAGGLSKRWQNKNRQKALENFNGDYYSLATDLMRQGDDKGAALAKELAETDAFSRIRQQQADADTMRAQAAARPRPPSASNLKLQYDAEDAVTSLTTNKANIARAKQLLQDGVYEGGLAGLQTEAGSKWNYGGVVDKLGIADSEKARRTAEYLNIMKPDAMTRMAEELKGSTAYQEILHYAAIYADPTVPNEVKAQMLDRILKSYDAQIAIKQQRQGQIGGAAGDQWEPGQAYDTPRGRMRYLGDDMWEDE